MLDKKTYLFVRETKDIDKLGHPITFKEFRTIDALFEEEAWDRLREQIRFKYPKRKIYEEELEKWEGGYFLILELKSIIGKSDYLPMKLSDSGEIMDEDLRDLKAHLLHRWKYSDPPILKRGSFIRRLKEIIIRSYVYYIPREVSLESLLVYWIDYYYFNNETQQVPLDIMKIFINSKPLEKLWQLF